MSATMNNPIYILRHAKAEDHTTPSADFSRKLTSHGISQAQKIAKFIRAKEFHILQMYSSELTRAVQTAHQLSNSLELDTATRVPWLNIYSDTDLAVKNILQISQTKPSIFVGHNPYLTDIVAKIIGAPHGSIRVRKASLIILTYHDESEKYRIDTVIHESLI